MLRTFRYRAYPTDQQAIRLMNQLDCCRQLYNACLTQRIMAWRDHRKSVTVWEQLREIPSIQQASPEFAAIQSHVLQEVVKRVEKAFSAFFQRVREKGRKKGFPRYRGRQRYRSLSFDVTGFRQDGTRMRLSKVGPVRLFLHRPVEGTAKRAVVKRDAVGDWFVSVVAELPDPPVRGDPTVIGVDLGLTHLVTTSDGLHIPPRKAFAGSLRKLRKEQRRLSRKQRGSRRREKQRVKVAKVHRKVERQRDDHLHKVSRLLAGMAGTIKFERLAIQNMVQGGRARPILDAGWGKLVQWSAYKAGSAGGRVALVDPRYTTQECAACHRRSPKELSERVHRCPCGLVLDRDENAAKVVEKRDELRRKPPTGGRPGSQARGDRASTTARNAVASLVREAGRPPL